MIGRLQVVKSLATNAVTLLGDVDELKVDREGPNHPYRFIGAQALKQPFKLPLGSARPFVRTLTAKSFAKRADILFDFKQALATEPPERFAQQIAQTANVRPQRRVLRLINARHFVEHLSEPSYQHKGSMGQRV